MTEKTSKSVKRVLGGKDSVRVCIAQISQAYLDRSQTVERACSAISEAARNEAQLIVFPEVWVAGYPYWTEGWDSRLADWARARNWFFDAAMLVPSEDTEVIGQALRRADMYAVIGCNEMDPRTGVNTVYNSLLFFDKDGSLMGRHRKLVPTFVERMYWGSGDASDINVYETDIGRIGGLICGENLVTTLRAAMIGMGEDLHVAVYPGAFALHTGPRLQEWNNAGDFWGHFVTRAHSLEAGCYTLCACSFLEEHDVPTDFPYKGKMHIEWSKGGSQVVTPLGIPVVGPVEGTEMIYADCKADNIKAFKAICDTLGHYSRPDAVKLLLHRAQGWQAVTEPYVSGVEPRLQSNQLRRTADAYEVDEDLVNEVAENLQAGAPKS